MTGDGEEAPATELVPVLAAERVSKSFGEVQVLFSVDFDVRPGEVHALVGENGAGKSTLVKILSGFESPSSGRLLLDGQPVSLPANGDAEALGIILIHQEFNLADHLTVAESLFLGREVTASVCSTAASCAPKPAVFSICWAPMWTRRADQFARRRRQADGGGRQGDQPRCPGDLHGRADGGPVAGRNRHSFRSGAQAASKGTSFVFVTHKLNEVMELSDRVTVLRDGQWIKTAPTSLLDSDSIAQLMVGRELSSLYPAKHEPDVDEEVVLSVRNLSTGYVKDVSFDLRKGEVLGFSGLIGSGRTEIMEAITGLRSRLSGEVRVKGELLPAHDLDEATRRGLAT